MPPHAVVGGRPDDDEFTLLAFESAFRNLAADLTIHHVCDLEVVMTV